MSNLEKLEEAFALYHKACSLSPSLFETPAKKYELLLELKLRFLESLEKVDSQLMTEHYNENLKYYQQTNKELWATFTR